MSKRMDRLSGSPKADQVAGREFRGGFWASLRSALGCRGGEKTSMETLEARQLLAGIAQSSEFAMLEWGGGTIEARRGSYLVEFDGYVGKQQAELLAREVATRLGADVVDARAFGLGRFASLQVSGAINAFDALALVGQVPHFKRVEPDRLYYSARLPNDSRFPEQYALRNAGQEIPTTGGLLGTAGADINVQNVWDISIGTRNNVVAIIDTGIDLQHPDLVNNIWVNPGEVPGNGIDDDGNGYVDDVNGYDFAELDANPDDEPTGGHGTPVAGTVGAQGNNALGVAGVNWNVSLMALKIADRFGRLSTNAIVAAHDYATMMLQRGVNIVASNNSYGGFAPAFYEDAEEGFVAERDAIQRFVNAGGTFVASAGNNGFDNDNPEFKAFPASYNIPQIIAVAASDNNDALAGFTNYGVRTVDVAAPGVQIMTTFDGGGYGYIDGTSFSGPIVAGIVALLKSIKPNASAVEIKQALIDGSDPLPSMQGKIRSGGRVNVERSLQILQTSGPVVRSVNPGPVVGQVNPATGQPYNTITIDVSKDLDPSLLTPASVTLVGSGPDDTFGNANDVSVTVTGVALEPGNPRRVIVSLNLAGFPSARLPIDTYRLTMPSNQFRDTSGNFLNGSSIPGPAYVHNFRVVSTSGDTEPNDTRATATPVVFNASGQATYSGLTIGNGLAGNLDVDLFRIDIPRGGQISAEVTARRLVNPSALDSVLRLFDAQGQQIAVNDNFYAQDSYIDFFVATGGTYYVGVSGFGNDRYDTAISASGTSQSLGVYNVAFRIQVSSDDTVFLPATDSGLPRRIPVDVSQTQGITTSAFTVLDSRLILDVNVKLDIAHTFTGDLVISLIGPNNREVTLVNRRGGDGDNFAQTVFDDEAALSVVNAFAPFNSPFRPEQSLGAYDGLSAAGRWTLKVNDTTALNSGVLNSWSLQFTFQNDIFGPFESNDTLVTAKDLAGISGTGTGTVTAFLGDGGFGVLDRDIFRFRADAGATLTASLTPTAAAGSVPLFNSALRLFDEAGAEIKLSNPAGTLSSGIENFVFSSSGIYYIAVSESSNVAYNPTIIGSGGVPAATTGSYSLSVALAPGVGDPALILAGNQVAVGVGVGGTFGAAASGVTRGMVFNGVEFLPVGGVGAQVFTGLVAAGYNWTNAGLLQNASNQLPFALTNLGDSFNNRVTAKGIYRGLQMERAISFGTNDSFFAIDLTFTNTTTTLLPSLAWMEGFNPDQGRSLGEGTGSTSNDIDAAGDLATASFFNNQFGAGLTVGLATPSSDARAKLTFIDVNTTIRDPQVLIGAGVSDPGGASADRVMAVSYDLGNLAAGASVSVRYFVMFGTTKAAVESLASTMNAGTGAGHLTATPASPASETLQTGGPAVVTVPTLPYRVYYPEGFYGNNIYNFLPISNPNDRPTRVVVIARYEAGVRDQLVGDLTLRPNTRSGLTLLTPELFASGNALAGRPGAGGGGQPYALEIRSELPVAATFSYYDLNQAGGARVGIGESFTTRVDTQWSFGNVKKGGGTSDFILFYNTTDRTEKVDVNFYPVSGGAPFTQQFRSLRQDGTISDGLDGFRRGGLSVNDIGFLPDGEYGVTISSAAPLVASLSRFDAAARTAQGRVGTVGFGSRNAVTPEGQFSINATTERLGVLNANASPAAVTLTFLLANGSAYRTLLTVPANTNRTVAVQDLVNFPTGTPYGISYESDQPVTVSTESPAFGDGVASEFADRAYSVWGFGEGFRPGSSDVHPGVTEYLRLYNPQVTQTVVEITIAYDGQPGFETFRRTLPARRVTEFDMDQFITGNRRLNSAWFSTTIKAAAPIVSYMGHFDRAFPGGFGTLGTPLGISEPLS
jgi:subtilisin family serine protease/subtilisin-like proprotein convertase family protein